MPPHPLTDDDPTEFPDLALHKLIAALLDLGMTMPAPLPSAGQIAPKIHAEARR